MVMKGNDRMYSIVFTKGNDERIITKVEDKQEAIRLANQFKAQTEYATGTVTVENRNNNAVKLIYLA